MANPRGGRTRRVESTPSAADALQSMAPQSLGLPLRQPGASLAGSLQWIHDQHNEVRPANTRKAYERKQQEWREWCARQTDIGLVLTSLALLISRFTVTQSKLAFFLQDYVLKKRRQRKLAPEAKRPSQPTPIVSLPVSAATSIPTNPTSTAITPPTSSPNNTACTTVDASAAASAVASSSCWTVEHKIEANDTADASDPFADGLGPASINQYIAAVVDLWRSQRHQGINNHPNPRGGAVTVLTQTLRLQQAKRHKESYADRGKGTLLDRISNAEQLVTLTNNGFEDTRKQRMPSSHMPMRHARSHALSLRVCSTWFDSVALLGGFDLQRC